MARQTFRLTHVHITLLSRTNIDWRDAEVGAPAIDPKRPYSGRGHYAVLAEVLGIEPIGMSDSWPSFAPADLRRMDVAHRELELALSVVLVTKSFVPGLYACDEYRRNWTLIEPELTAPAIGH